MGEPSPGYTVYSLSNPSSSKSRNRQCVASMDRVQDMLHALLWKSRNCISREEALRQRTVETPAFFLCTFGDPVS